MIPFYIFKRLSSESDDAPMWLLWTKLVLMIIWMVALIAMVIDMALATN